MKNLAYLSIIISLLVTPLNALEKKDCSSLKKLSKAFIACKSANFKAGVVNAGSNIKKNTIGKVKKKEKNTGETTVRKKTTATKEKTKGIKNKLNKMFSGKTKQYPKGTK